GNVDHEEGRLDAARARYRRAADAGRASGIPRVEAYTAAYDTIALYEQGEHSAARMQLLEALPLLRASGDRTGAAMFTAVLGAFEAGFDHLDRARELCDAADAEAAECADAPSQFVARLCRGHIDHAEAKQAEARGDRNAAQHHRDRARALVEEGRASTE